MRSDLQLQSLMTHSTFTTHCTWHFVSSMASTMTDEVQPNIIIYSKRKYRDWNWTMHGCFLYLNRTYSQSWKEILPLRHVTTFNRQHWPAILYSTQIINVLSSWNKMYRCVSPAVLISGLQQSKVLTGSFWPQRVTSRMVISPQVIVLTRIHRIQDSMDTSII